MLKIPSRSGHIFLLILSAALLYCLFNLLTQFDACAARGVCLWMEDFTVAYQPALALVSGNLAGVYEAGIVQDFLMGTKNIAHFRPVLYPPYGLFLVYPLGWLDPVPAEVTWFCVHTVLLLLVLRLRAVRTLFSDLPAFYICVFFLPYCAFNLLAGQVGMLTAALFLLVIVWRKTHPILCGLAFAILCFKPQMVFALFIVLVREKNALVLKAALIAVVTLIVASFGLWGGALWRDYLQTGLISAMIFNTAPVTYVHNSVSFFLAVHMLGGSDIEAHLLQLLLTGIVMVTLWRSVKRCRDDTQIFMLVAPATFVLTHHFFIYDTVLLAAVCALLAGRITSGNSSIVSRLLLVMLAFLPIIALRLNGLHIPYAAFAIVFAYGVAVFQLRKEA